MDEKGGTGTIHEKEEKDVEAQREPPKAPPHGHASRPRQPAIHGHSIRSCPSFLGHPHAQLAQLDQLVEDAGRELGEDVAIEIPFHSEAKQATNHHDPHTRSRSQPRRMVVVMMMVMMMMMMMIRA